jgi:GNAT superfamily N-acetyltransferase
MLPRPLVPDDLAAVDRIQRSSYRSDFVEDRRVFADKLARYPAGCWVCEVDEAVVGYLFSHPACFHAPPKLNELLPPPAGEPDCYFLHDLVVLPDHRLAGVGRRLVANCLAHGVVTGFSRVALVSVQNSSGYWMRAGFELVAETEPVVELVRRSYGRDARYMIRGGELAT